MRSTAVFLILVSVVLGTFDVARATSPFHVWSKGFAATGSASLESCAIDADGNIVIAGWFSDTLNFGGDNLVAQNFDMFVAKFDRDGNHTWSQRFGGAGAEAATSVDCDPSGNVIIGGFFDLAVDFGGDTLTSAGSYDIFIVKLNTTGGFVWSFGFGDGSSQFVNAMLVDPTGAVYATGNLEGTVNFGGADLTSAGSEDVYLVKLNSAGAHQWSARFGDMSFQRVFALALNGSSDVAIAGFNYGTMNFGGAPVVTAGQDDIFIAKFTSGGAHAWSAGFGDASSQSSSALAFDGTGSLLFAGTFSGTVNFGGGALVSAGQDDLCVAKFSAGNTHVWSSRFGDALSQGLGFSELGADADGNVIGVGVLTNTVNFGGGALTSAGINDIFHVRFGSDGVHKASDRSGDADNNVCRAMDMDAAGRVVVVGESEGVLDFGGGPLQGVAYVAIFASYLPVIDEINDVGNDQGRSVRIRFSKSGYDATGSPTPVTDYVAFRRIDPLPVAAPARVAAPDTRALDGWEFAASTPAFGDGIYNLIAPTLADSTTSEGQHYSVFLLRAATANPLVFYSSPIDSGYSLDNLAPSAPTSFAYSAPELTWDESPAADFDYFTVYGSSTNSFGSAVVVDYTTGTTLDVSTSPYVYYFVTATDFSGNEGNPAVLNTLSSAGEPPTPKVLSVSAHPNPFNPSTTIRYTVPHPGRMNLAVFDTRGALVATLVDEHRPAGAFSAQWNGRSDEGRPAASGVYFARVAANGQTRSYKLVLLK